MQFDPAKNEANIAKHGVSLERAAEMDIQAVLEDDRHDYGETRYRAFGLIDGIAHCLVFTDREGVLRGDQPAPRPSEGDEAPCPVSRLSMLKTRNGRRPTSLALKAPTACRPTF
ncbi:BrnT family toxin [Caulobacter sp.]|uniref:BrnT family toxin n=1 Tax=Caulobacter sp. TaxID=78 RepID=UPI001B151A91|nr:BrnT family toxin [Caulobacter sp.]MBO9543649.1 BrnT family toxin [Caulobacter sp.]